MNIKKFLIVFLTFSVLLSVEPVFSAQTGFDMLQETFDSGIGKLTPSGNVQTGKDKNKTVAIINGGSRLTYSPKGDDTGWDSSYSSNYKVKMENWGFQSDVMLIFRIKSEANDSSYIIYYSKSGFNLSKIVPPSKVTTVVPFTGAISADSSLYHDIRIDAVDNKDGTCTVKLYFDGIKKIEYLDKDKIPKVGGIMIINNMTDNEFYVDEITVSEITDNSVASSPDDPSVDVVGTEYEDETTVLRLLGIMDNYHDGIFRLDYIMTRGEFTEAVIKMLGMDSVAKSFAASSKFEDVPDNHELAGYINLASDLNIVSGYSGNLFIPDEILEFNQALKMLICAFGYNLDAERYGGYPEGYLIIASQIGLLKNISEYKTSRGVMTRLLFNCLEIPLKSIVKYSNGNDYKIEKGKTILEALDILCNTGIVTDNGTTALTGESSVVKNTIRIGYIDFNAGETSAKKYLGYNVKYYARENDGEYTILYINPHENGVYTFDYKKISSKTTTDEFYYETFNGKIKSLYLSKVKDVIYNGKSYPEYKKEDLKPEDGNVTLIDNNNDGVIDVLLVTSYKAIIVNSISSINKTLYNKVPNAATSQIILDETNKIVEIYKSGKKIGFEDIKNSDVVKIAMSADNKYILANVSSTKVRGTVSEFNDDYIFINGTEYEPSSSYFTYLNNKALAHVQIGLSYTFYLDNENRIEFSVLNSEKNESYGYLRNADYSDNISNTIELEVLTQSGTWQIYNLADEVKYNNEIIKANDLICSDLISTKVSGVITHIIPQLILYKTNSDDKINMLKTSMDRSAAGSGSDLLCLENAGSLTYKTINKSFNSTYFIEDSTVFVVPTSDIFNDDFYYVTTSSYFLNDNAYNIEIYNMDNNCPAAVVMKKAFTYTDSVEKTSGVLMVDSVLRAINNEGYDCCLIKGYYNGKYVQYFVKENINTAALNRGDVFQFVTNSKGEIINIGQNKLADGTQTKYNDDGGFNATARFVTGKVCYVDKNSKRVVINLDNSIDKTASSIWIDCKTTNIKYYLYDKKADSTRIASFDNVDVGCDIFVRLSKENAYEVVIYLY